MRPYTDIVRAIIVNGTLSENRTGVPAHSFPGAIFQHNMSEGFPLLTTKKMPFGRISSELEFFIKGITDKQWLQDRGNKIWNEWCWEKKVPYGHDKKTKKLMAKERDLGPIYGFQWRYFDAKYDGFDKDYTGQGVDQLENLIEDINTNPGNRRMMVSAWNPKQVWEMALPPCHYSFQVTVTNPSIDEETGEKKGKLNLMWNQRSVDTALGLPFNIASYGLLLHLLAKETGYEEGKLVGHLGDVHIYENHMEGLLNQLSRVPLKLCDIETDNFTSIFDWEYTDSVVVDYESHDRIDFGKPAV